MKTYSLVYFGTALIAVFLTPLVSRLAKRLGLLDVPGVRKIHKEPVARMGGIVFVIAVLLITLPVFLLNNVIGDAFNRVQGQLITLLVCGVFIFLVGVFDDLRSVRATLKLLALAGCGMAMYWSGARIQVIGVEGLFEIDFGWLSLPITILWITGITVGINFIDGLDGLAAGISAIVCATIAGFAYYSGQLAMTVLMLSLLGALTGFLFFNFNPAKIFMGDGGSMFLGFMISAGSVVCEAKSATLVGIALPALVLGVPILDTTFTMIRRRILDRRSMFAAERGHIHHRLLDMGLHQRTVVLIMYAVTLVGAGLGVVMLVVSGANQIRVLAGGVLFLFVVFAVSGTTRIRETIAAMKRNKAIARKQRTEQSVFEDAQLRVREAKTFDAWWEAVCIMASEMEIDRLAVSFPEGQDSTEMLVWQLSEGALLPGNVANMSFEIHHPEMRIPMRLDVAVRRNGSWELSGRRAVFLSRLLDEGPIPLEAGPSMIRQHELRPLLFGQNQKEASPLGGEEPSRPVSPRRDHPAKRVGAS